MARKVTKGIREDIDEEIQIKIWNAIDMLKRMDNFSVGHLQVFELRKTEDSSIFNNCYNQKITYCREKSAYMEEIFVKVANPVDAEVYVVEDLGHSVMMKNSEYC
ncbi:DUF960 family protein [Clostridium sp. WILCCON 0269]|uniref:DUF960 family protein n=1 Tax=Candidatus Clostridium eludens TaxID=3381663 RepID=A0ABW8SPY1_9CLOT